MKIILGSASPGRQKILRDAGYTFEVMTADINEKAIRHDDFIRLPLLIAQAKAQALLQKIHEPAVLITADLVAVCNGQLREKPQSHKELRTFLKSYSQNFVTTHCATVVTNTTTKKQESATVTATTYFSSIPSAVITALANDPVSMNAAGGFIVEDKRLIPYIMRIDGEIDAVTGLPVKILGKLIDEVE